MSEDSLQPDQPIAVMAWKQSASLYRRFLARIGLQGKLILSFLFLLSLGLGGSCWLFVSHSSELLSGMMGEQARQISNALALATKQAMASGHHYELNRIGQDFLKSHNILFVAFLDTDAKTIVLASRDPEFGKNQLSALRHNTQVLMQVHAGESAVFGEYLEVIAPIVNTPLGTPPADTALGEKVIAPNSRLLGYVAVGVSQAREQAQLERINYFVVGIGCVMVIISLPLAYMLVHRIFWPIRQLVEATVKIAAGNLDTQVAIHRPDVIGTLARSFNEMVMKVKAQQQELEDANDQLANINRDLEQKVFERTAQLETTNKRLSSEIAEKEDFLRAVSHDLNAPLRNIAGMATMLLMKYRGKIEEDMVHRLERIQKNVEVETDLIAELLELSRIKSRRQRMETLDLHETVRELCGLFENDLNTKKIRIILEKRLPVIVCEKARLRQVFQNLIDNAIKYMGTSQTRHIKVGCKLNTNDAEFYVADTGMGIEEEDLPKVFHVFRRGKGSAVQAVAGKGVGLSLVKSIVETYGGRIWVESQLGKGTTFRFTIDGKYVPAINAEAEALVKMAMEESIAGMAVADAPVMAEA